MRDTTILINGEPFTYRDEIDDITYETISPISNSDAKELLVLTKQLFNRKGIKFSLVFGTLLGAVRDKSVVTGDEDVDVFVESEEENAVNDDTVQLFVVFLLKQFSIRTDSVQRDDQIAIHHIAFVIVEGDDIGIVVVSQILAIDGKNMLVVTKQIAHLADLLAVGGCNTTNPSRRLATLDVGELDVFSVIGNHILVITL